MAIERVKEHLSRWNRVEDIKEFTQSSATVELAAEALGCEPQRIAKSLSFDLSGQAILVVAAGDARLDNKKYRQEFGMKARMLSRESVEDVIGHDVGGVCPFGINEGVSVYLDESLKRFESIFPACGSSNSAIELSCSELEEYSGSVKWVDVFKDWE